MGNVWLGFAIYYGLLLAVLLLAGALVCALRKGGRNGKVYGVALCLSLCGALALFGYGLVHAQQTRVVTYDLSVDKSAAEG